MNDPLHYSYTHKCLWEIFVPATTKYNVPIPVERHQEWDERVCALAGGLTLYSPVKGKYQSDSILIDQMIPVRIACTHVQIEQIAQITCDWYDQESVLFWEVSPNVKIWKNTNLPKQ